jgi:hypothetical protein
VAGTVVVGRGVGYRYSPEGHFADCRDDGLVVRDAQPGLAEGRFAGEDFLDRRGEVLQGQPVVVGVEAVLVIALATPREPRNSA